MVKSARGKITIPHMYLVLYRHLLRVYYLRRNILHARCQIVIVFKLNKALPWSAHIAMETYGNRSSFPLSFGNKLKSTEQEKLIGMRCYVGVCFNFVSPNPPEIFSPHQEFLSVWWIPLGWTVLVKMSRIRIAMLFLSFVHRGRVIE